jgi:hypothetical protein
MFNIASIISNIKTIVETADKANYSFTISDEIIAAKIALSVFSLALSSILMILLVGAFFFSDAEDNKNNKTWDKWNLGIDCLSLLVAIIESISLS